MSTPDVVDVDVWGYEETKSDSMIISAVRIPFPLLGPIASTGRRRGEEVVVSAPPISLPTIGMATQRRLGARENAMHNWRAGETERRPDEVRMCEQGYNKRQRSEDAQEARKRDFRKTMHSMTTPALMGRTTAAMGVMAADVDHQRMCGLLWRPRAPEPVYGARSFLDMPDHFPGDFCEEGRATLLSCWVVSFFHRRYIL